MRLRNTLAILLLLSLSACVFLGVRWQQAERRAAATTRWTRFVIDSLGTTIPPPPPAIEPWGRDSVYWQWVATSARIQSRRWQLAVQLWTQARGTLLNDSDIEFLHHNGLSDPPRQLRDSLKAHPELIPYEPVLGGTMFFDDIAVLQYPFVFATFEDGHIDGSMLLEYDIVSDRPIHWTRLWARLN